MQSRRSPLRLLRATLAVCVAVSTLAVSRSHAQVLESELRVDVRDPSGRPVSATIFLASRSPQFHADAKADSSGRARFPRIPQGIHQLTIREPGFEPWSQTVEIRSAMTREIVAELKLGTLATEVVVRDSAPLLDPLDPAMRISATRRQLAETMGTTIGRSAIDVLTTMPGWLLEANAVLHPRGSEYDTQYVVDGLPLYDNRSLSFAPAFENGAFETIEVMTAGIPAEYGRRLGGVIAMDSRRIGALGHSSELTAQAGSYQTYLGSILHQFRSENTGVSMALHGGRTDRYLDPPSLENFTNDGASHGAAVRIDQDLGARDRLTLSLRSDRVSFLVPNDLDQQANGQRQDRRSRETAGQAHYSHTFSSTAMASVKGLVRDLDARLWSNPFATPVWVNQDRGFRESAAIGTFTLQGERHTLKTGADVRINGVREQIELAEPDELPDLDLAFRDRKRSLETAAFVQDHLRLGRLALAVGVRLDHYDFLVSSTAASPRVAVSYFIPKLDLIVRGSFDRIFQPPPPENLLFSSAAAGLQIDDVEGGSPLRPSRANFFELGFRKAVANHLRIDVSHYWRSFRNSIDDDVFLNTGISFPITFDKARIRGTEVRLELPAWRVFSGFVSYSNMLGTATSPVTGGLFVEGGEAEELRNVVRRFPITQDQRNTLAAQIRVEPHPRIWTIAAFRYGSGLPIEVGDDEEDVADAGNQSSSQPIPESILERVNFDRGRVRPNSTMDLAIGALVWHRATRSARLQLDARNIADRLNVVNFNGLFSGTALAPGRQITLQLRVTF